MSQRTEFENSILQRAATFASELHGNTLNGSIARAQAEQANLTAAENALTSDITELERVQKTLEFAIEKRRKMLADIQTARKANYEHQAALNIRSISDR